MPSSIQLNGARIFRPGIQADIDTSALGGRGTSTGNVALVGDLLGFQKSTPTQFTSARALLDHDPADDELKLLAKLAFSPAADDAVPGGASSLWVVSTNTSTQAFANVLDSNAAPAMVLSSKVWGLAGNRLAYTLAISGDDHTLTLTRDGLIEIFEIETPVMGIVQYTGGVLTTAVLQWNSAEVRYEWTRLLGPAVLGVYAEADDWDHSPCAGPIKVTLSVAAGAGESVAITITGTDLAGAPLVEVVEIANLDDEGTSAGSFGSITNVGIAETSATWVGNTTLGCDNGRVISHAGRKISGIMTELGEIPGVAASTEDPRAGSIASLDADWTDGEQNVAVAYNVRANTKLVLNGILASRLVTGARGTSGLAPAAVAATNFAGGSNTSPVGTTDWQAALDTIVDKDVQIVVPLSTDSAVHGLLSKHCTDSALQGYERDAWAGAAGSQTKAQMATAAAALNTRYVALVGQQVEVDHPNGTTPTLEPSYLALILAGMQAGSPIAWPLTHNRPRVRDVYQTWAPNLDAAELISKGVCTLSEDTLGWRVERSITTYLTDDNPILSEVSSWESVQTSVRDLRNALIARIGNPTVAGTAGRIRSAAADRLDEQVRVGWIKAWQNISVDDLGDTFRINVDLAPVEPINFIVLAFTVTRIPGV